MPTQIRIAFPYVILAACICGICWAVSFTSIPPADFAFQNGDDVKSLDPARATGEPEHNILNCLFEGLLRTVPGEVDAQGNRQIQVRPGASELPEISDDFLTYTFRIRDNVKWSDGSPVTSHDFFWSWRRTLHPHMAGEYARQLYYVTGGEAYNTAQVQPGDRVEVELKDRRDSAQAFPRGTIVRGELQEIVRGTKPKVDEESEDGKKQLSQWRDGWVYAVKTDGDDGAVLHFTINMTRSAFFEGEVQEVHHVLPEFESTVGLSTPDAKTLVVKLHSPTPFFPTLTCFYTLFPVHRESVERHGAPNWTKAENLVSNGAYRLGFRRLRDRIRMVKNEHYWNVANVELETIDAYAVKQQTTALNMYLRGQLHWVNDPPNPIIEQLQKRDDASVAPYMNIYFFRLNTDRKPLDDVRVRRALNLAINKKQIVEEVTRAGQIPAQNLVPPLLADYKSPEGEAYNPALAAELLAEAGYPGGRNVPTLTILYNTRESHRAIAEVIQQQWQNNLNVKAKLENMEWGTYLDKTHKRDFVIARGGWIADYPDPTTFLELWITGGAHNSTGWSNAEYDRLLEKSRVTSGAERMEVLSQAEQIVLDGMPFIPLYFYTRTNLVSPKFTGLGNNVMEWHPLSLVKRANSE